MAAGLTGIPDIHIPGGKTLADIFGTNAQVAVGGALPNGSKNPVATGTTGAINAGTGVVQGAVDASKAIPDFLGKLGNANLWIRVAEFAVGGIFVAIGVSAMLKGGPVSDAAKGVLKTATPIGRAASMAGSAAGRKTKFIVPLKDAK
jgi:hypothetical protein